MQPSETMWLRDEILVISALVSYGGCVCDRLYFHFINYIGFGTGQGI